MSKQTRVLVTGAGGFIGHHLTESLVKRGYWVRADNCIAAAWGIDEVYALAANMGGIGFIESHKAVIVRDNTQINMNTIEAARIAGVRRLLYTSSACVYPGYLQNSQDVIPLKEQDAYPADPEDGYGWEKLYMERTCRHYREDFGLDTRIVRFHNIYGPLGTYDGGREKSPAAICRKVALATDRDTIEVWGDGCQTRSYCYITDCVEGIYRIMQSGYPHPLNLGTDYLVSINELVDTVARIAGKNIRKRYDLTKPQGVRGRNSDNSLLLETLNWQPTTSLEQGLATTYEWIRAELDPVRPLMSSATA